MKDQDEEDQDEHKLDQSSENITENPLSFQNLLEGRVSKVELLFAAFSSARKKSGESSLKRSSWNASAGMVGGDKRIEKP